MFKAFENYGDFSGRAARSEYWWFFLWDLIIWAIVITLLFKVVIGLVNTHSATDFKRNFDDASFLIGVTIAVFWLLVSFVPRLSVTVRRLHDLNLSGWIYLLFVGLGFIPYIGRLANICFLVLLRTKGTFGDNAYGQDPLNRWQYEQIFA